jgi:hypothetical protein
MTAKETIEKRLEKLAQAIGPDESLIENVMSRIETKSIGESERIEKLSTKFIARRFIMNPFTKLAAAAVIIIVVFAGLHYLSGSIDGTTPAYGITDILESVRGAKTIHIKGRNFFPLIAKSNQEQKTAPFEYWLDIENERARIKHTGNITKDGETIITHFEDVINGQYRMHIDHSKKCVNYYEINKSERQHLIKQNFDSQIKQIFGDPDEIEAFVLIGEEQIDNSAFDIWQAEVYSDPNSRVMLRIKMWLSPASGEIARIHIWLKKEQSDWSLGGEIDKIERNVTPPAGIFETEPPEGYVVKNSKHKTEKPKLPKSAWYQKEAAIVVYHGFTLEDGSVIAAWSSAKLESGSSWTDGKELADISQIELFENLQPGVPLPKLPVVISALKRRSLWGKKPIYIGRHLAYTLKDNKIYEWAIYVPQKKLSRSLLGYDTTLEFNPKEQASNLNYKIGVHANLLVNAENFETLLLDYMADFSDDGLVPEHITYENLLKLAKEIRKSLAQ